MCFIWTLLPATIFAVLGYFLLFASTKAEGAFRTVGHVLAIWVFILAVSLPIMGAYLSVAGLCPMETMMEQLMEHN